MNLKWCAVGCVIFLVCGVAEASFLGGLFAGAAEQREVNAAPDCTLSADAAYDQVVNLLSDGRQVEAEEFILSALKTYPANIRILFAKAVLERSRWNKSSANFWFSMTQRAKGKEYLAHAAWLTTKLDQGQEVEDNINELIRLSDNHPDNVFLIWLGAIQCRQQTRVGSTLPVVWQMLVASMGKERYEKLLAKFRLGPVMLHHTYANLLTESLRDYDEAMKHREIAISMTSGDWAFQGLGNTLLAMKDYEKANAVWARVVRMEPDDASYWNCWGDALFALDHYSEATEKYEHAMELNPRERRYRDDWMKSKEKEKWAQFEELKEREMARERKERIKKEVLEDAVRENPNDPEALSQLTSFLFSSPRKEWKDYPRIAGFAQRAVAIQPTMENLEFLGNVYCRMEQYGEAAETAKQRIALYQKQHPNAPVLVPEELRIVMENFERSQASLISPRAALEYEENKLREEPNSSERNYAVACNLLRNQDEELLDYPRAITLLKRAVELADYPRKHLYQLAKAYYLNQQYAEAVSTMKKVIQCRAEKYPEREISASLKNKLIEYEKALEASKGSGE